METLFQTLGAFSIVAIVSILFFIYIDSVENCWRYTTRRIELEDEDELLVTTHTPSPFSHQYIPIFASPSAIAYSVFLLLGTIPIVNTILLLHSMKPFFEKVNLKNEYQKTGTYVRNLLSENIEYRSKLYQSSVLNFIAKWYYGINSDVLFK